MKSDNLQTIRQFTIKNGYKSLKGKRILTINKDKVYFIHERCFKKSEIELFSDYSKHPYNFRVFGGEKPNSDMVEWIYSNYFVVPDEVILAKNKNSGEFECFNPKEIEHIICKEDYDVFQ